MYKDDEESKQRKKFVVPKSEVNDLLLDLRNPLPFVNAESNMP